jgi:hypothetical protein
MSTNAVAIATKLDEALTLAEPIIAKCEWRPKITWKRGAPEIVADVGNPNRMTRMSAHEKVEIVEAKRCFVEILRSAMTELLPVVKLREDPCFPVFDVIVEPSGFKLVVRQLHLCSEPLFGTELVNNVLAFRRVEDAIIRATPPSSSGKTWTIGEARIGLRRFNNVAQFLAADHAEAIRLAMLRVVAIRAIVSGKVSLHEIDVFGVRPIETDEEKNAARNDVEKILFEIRSDAISSETGGERHSRNEKETDAAT